MKNKFRLAVKMVVFVLGMAITLPQAQAQCPMCKISAESNLKNGGTAGKGLNAGILFMLSVPYLLVGTIGYVWWRNRQKPGEQPLSDPE